MDATRPEPAALTVRTISPHTLIGATFGAQCAAGKRTLEVRRRHRDFGYWECVVIWLDHTFSSVGAIEIWPTDKIREAPFSPTLARRVG